ASQLLGMDRDCLSLCRSRHIHPRRQTPRSGERDPGPGEI
ncbi:uncharacterized protein METZ01_LOCUS484830, partial [marine metagenome]